MTNERGFLICLWVAIISAILAAVFQSNLLILVVVVSFICGVYQALKRDE